MAPTSAVPWIASAQLTRACICTCSRLAPECEIDLIEQNGNYVCAHTGLPKVVQRTQAMSHLTANDVLMNECSHVIGTRLLKHMLFEFPSVFLLLFEFSFVFL